MDNFFLFFSLFLYPISFLTSHFIFFYLFVFQEFSTNNDLPSDLLVENSVSNIQFQSTIIDTIQFFLNLQSPHQVVISTYVVCTNNFLILFGILFRILVHCFRHCTIFVIFRFLFLALSLSFSLSLSLCLPLCLPLSLSIALSLLLSLSLFFTLSLSLSSSLF